MIRAKKRVAIVILHGSEETAQDMLSFFYNAPLGTILCNNYIDIIKGCVESFGDIPFANVADILGIAIAAPSAEEREYSPAGVEVRKVWFNRSRGWAQLGMEDDYEDIQGIQLSSLKILQFITDIQSEYDYIFLGGFEMGGAMALHMVFKQLHDKVAGVFAIASFISSKSALLPPLLPETEICSRCSSTYVPVVMMHGRIFIFFSLHDDIFTQDKKMKAFQLNGALRPPLRSY